MDATPVLIPVVVLFLLGATLVALGADRRRRRQARPTRYLVAGAILAAIALIIPAYLVIRADTTRFVYRVTLEPEGTGTVRVSVPSPVDEALIGNLAPSGAGSSIAMNRTSNESAIEVTLSEATTLTATFEAYRYGRPFAMTRAADLGECDLNEPCNATVSVLVLSGNVTGVRVRAVVSWSDTCESWEWWLDQVVVAGEHAYAARWVLAVC